MIVTKMQLAPTPLEVTYVHATLDSLEMVICVQVSNENSVLIMQHCTIRHFLIYPKWLVSYNICKCTYLLTF